MGDRPCWPFNHSRAIEDPACCITDKARSFTASPRIRSDFAIIMAGLQTRVSPSRQRSSIRFAPGPRLQLSRPIVARSDPVTSSQDGLRSSTRSIAAPGSWWKRSCPPVLTNLQWEPSCGLAMQRKNFECRKEPVNSEVAEISRAVHGKQQSAREQYGIADRRSGDLRGLESVRSSNGSNQKEVYAQAVILQFPIQSIGCYVTHPPQ